METTVKCINHEVVASIYKRCYGKLLAYLAGCTHDTMDAEDMAQDIFVKMLSIGVVTEATAEALLFVMARRMIIDDARHKAFVRQGMKQLACTVSQYDTHSVARRLEVDELLERERAVLARMAPKRARVYEMYRHEELSAKEIAARLDISRRTVETHIYLSTKEMKRQMHGIV
jgi:RNA polymerase sigma factor (sigma-70 family)